jgi:bifunctional non-homologous end joining protein LigD
MAATLVQALPEGDDWLYEVKLDGYRALVVKDGDDVQLRSRNDRSLTAAYPTVAAAGSRLRAARAVVAGAIVAVDARGRPSFQALQNRGSYPGYVIAFYAFDLLHLDGEEMTTLPLEARKRRLTELLRGSALLLSAPLPGTASQVIAAVRQLGLEGVVAKRKSSPYLPGVRSASWQKLKLDRQQEFVIGGYRPGTHGIDALLVGFYEEGRLLFAGKVRAGFTPQVRRNVFAKLKPLHAARCPFADLPASRSSHWGGGVTAEQMAEMQWLRPALVAQIRFVEWTVDGHLRHAAFVGLRDDKAAAGVTRT